MVHACLRRQKEKKCRRNAMKMKKEIKSRALVEKHKAGDQREGEENFQEVHNNCAQVCKHFQMEKCWSLAMTPASRRDTDAQVVFFYSQPLRDKQIFRIIYDLIIFFGSTCLI